MPTFPPKPKSVSIQPRQLSLSRGQTAQVQATVTPAQASKQSLVWSSSDPTVFTVNHVTGAVRASDSITSHRQATLHIRTLGDGGVRDSIPVDVHPSKMRMGALRTTQHGSTMTNGAVAGVVLGVFLAAFAATWVTILVKYKA